MILLPAIVGFIAGAVLGLLGSIVHARRRPRCTRCGRVLVSRIPLCGHCVELLAQRVASIEDEEIEREFGDREPN
jgi:hypothetical protein